MATTINWELLETEYVTGQISLRGLAEKHGVSERQIFERSKEYQWVNKRGNWRSRIAAESQQKAGEEASEVSALIFRIGKLILQRFLVALKEGGLNLTASDAERWAKILLALEQAGKAGEARRIVVQWVTNDRPGDNHTIYPTSETGSVPPEQGPLPIFRGGDRIREDEGGGAGIPPPGV